jgi:hypothetical protein
MMEIAEQSRISISSVARKYEIRGGRVCLDSLKQFLNDKLLCLMTLPASEVVCSSNCPPKTMPLLGLVFFFVKPNS